MSHCLQPLQFVDHKKVLELVAYHVCSVTPAFPRWHSAPHLPRVHRSLIACTFTAVARLARGR